MRQWRAGGAWRCMGITELDFTLFAAVLGAAYLLGAAPFAVLISRAFGLADPRTFGSGNPGATNVARGGGKIPAALTLLADAGKGFVPVFLLGDNILLSAAAGAAAVCGHVFSVFLRFRGGKGVATAFGVFFAWYFPAAFAAAVLWALVFWRFRIAAAASVAAMLFAAAVVVAAKDGALPVFAAAVAALVIFKHRRNIADMIRGRENRFTPRRDGTESAALRVFMAVAALSGVLFSVAAVHDYPATRNQINLIRAGDTEAARRPWIAMFYFINEAGSGVKFFITGNEKHMRHYPSVSHLQARRTARADAGDWRAQSSLARGFYYGENGQERDAAAALHWLLRALQTAPEEERPHIARLIRELEQETGETKPPNNGGLESETDGEDIPPAAN